jgi:hypothetical protein
VANPARESPGLKRPGHERSGMTDPLVVEAGDMPPQELLTTLEEGRRIVVRTEFLGSEHEVTLRYDGDVYYCDTPTRLHRHDSSEEMQTCLERQGYAADDGD